MDLAGYVINAVLVEGRSVREVAERDAHLLGQLRQLHRVIALDETHSRYLLHGGPLPCRMLLGGTPDTLPAARSQAGTATSLQQDSGQPRRTGETTRASLGRRVALDADVGRLNLR